MAEHKARKGKDECPVQLPDVFVRWSFSHGFHGFSLILLLSELALPTSRVSQIGVNREHRNRGEYHADKVPPDGGPDGFEIARFHQTGKFDQIFVSVKRMGNVIDDFLPSFYCQAKILLEKNRETTELSRVNSLKR